MKKVLLYTYLLSIICIAISCNGNPNKKIGQPEKVNDTLTKQGITNKISVSIEALQGIWAENDNDNALFFIKADSLYYVEDQAKPIKIILNSDTFVMMGDVPAHCRILKLTKDSLWFIDEFSNTPTKLCKR